jgi:hypothetical protein
MTRALLFTAILLTLPFVVGCESVAAWYHPAITQIRADLPVGSSLERVDSYLDQHNIDHTYYRNSNQVAAYIHNIQRDALVREDLYVVFSFDDYKSLRDILAKPVHTQP